MVLRCPICKKICTKPPTGQDGQELRPFCSSRCKQIDLGNWLSEKYRISRPLTDDDLGPDGAESLPYFVSGGEGDKIN